MSRIHLLAALAASALLAACNTYPIVIGPAGLDASSPAAPRCGPQQYPFHALENHERGNVTLQVGVDAGGAVRDAALAASSGSAFLDAAALDGVRFCHFAPAAADRQQAVVFAYELVGGDEHLPRGVVNVGVPPGVR
jgi:TonB family protein